MSFIRGCCNFSTYSNPRPHMQANAEQIVAFPQYKNRVFFFFDTTDQHLPQHAHHWLPIRVLFQLEDKKSLSARSGLYAGRGETRQISTCAWTSTAIVKNCVTIAHKVFPEISNRGNSLPLCQNFQRNSITTRCLNHTSTIVLTTMHAFCFRLLPLDVARIQ